MTAPSIQHLIDSLPKAELHVHIEGCIEVRSCPREPHLGSGANNTACTVPCHGD